MAAHAMRVQSLRTHFSPYTACAVRCRSCVAASKPSNALLEGANKALPGLLLLPLALLLASPAAAESGLLVGVAVALPDCSFATLT